MIDARALLRRMFDAAIDAAQPAHCLPAHLTSVPKGRTIVVGAGKASAARAKAFDETWARPLTVLVADPTTRADAVDIIRRYAIDAPTP